MHSVPPRPADRRRIPTALCTVALLGAAPLACPTRDPGRTTAATAPAAAAAAVTVTVDAGRTRQSLVGFGAATAYYQNWIAAHPNKASLYDALFRGLKLDILRLQNTYRPGREDPFAENDRDIVRGARASLGYPVTVLMSSWSPPASLKSNRSEKDGGTLARATNGGFAYGKFADYWRDSLLAYRKAGIDPKYVSLQNEPDFKAEWESCLFLPSEGRRDGAPVAGYDRALAAVHDRLRTLPAPPLLVGPETLGVGGGSTQRYLPPGDRARLARVGAVAHHLYSGGTHLDPDTFVGEMRAIRDDYPDRLRFQTEFGRSNGIQTAWLIHNSLVEEEAHAYVYWAGIWPGDDALITIDNPWTREAWRHPGGFRLNDRYYALKHFSYFTAPGYRRVHVATAGADRAVKASAYLSPDGRSLAVVALNTSATGEKTLRLDLRGFEAGPAGGVYRTRFDPSGGSAVPLAAFEDLGVPGRDGLLTLPPHSVVTVTFQKQE